MCVVTPIGKFQESSSAPVAGTEYFFAGFNIIMIEEWYQSRVGHNSGHFYSGKSSHNFYSNIKWLLMLVSIHSKGMSSLAVGSRLFFFDLTRVFIYFFSFILI